MIKEASQDFKTALMFWVTNCGICNQKEKLKIRRGGTPEKEMNEIKNLTGIIIIIIIIINSIIIIINIYFY